MKNVFKYTLIQSLKGTGTKVMTIIFCAVILLSVPFLHWMNDKDVGGTKIDKVLVWDETGLGISDFSGMKEKSNYKNTEFGTATSEEDVKGNTLLVHITQSEIGYKIRYVAAADSDLSEMAVMTISEDFEEEFQKLRENSQNLTATQRNVLHTEVTQDVKWLLEDGSVPQKDDSSEFSMEQYNLSLILLIVFVMLISFSAEGVATAVVTEKSNKLVENLMILVRTKDMIMGKILGTLAVVVLQMALMVASFFLSALISMLVFQMDSFVLPEQIATYVSFETLPGLNPVNLILAILTFLAGVLFFAILAALFGAAISRMEDMGEGMKVFNVILVLSAYLTIFLSMSQMGGTEDGVLGTVISLIPFCTPFHVPTALLTGQVSVVIGLLALAIQIVAIVLLLKLVIRLYAAMILHKGNVLKLRQIFGLAKGKEDLQ